MTSSNFPQHPYIETENCIIKLAEINHAALLCNYYINNKSNFIPWEHKRNKEFYTEDFWQQQVKQSLKLFNSKQAVKLVALNKSESKVIASCNFSNIVFGCFYACHLGYSIDKNSEGKGIMFEVISASINYMIDEFKLHRIMANHMPNNHRSEKLLKKLGFEKEGYAKAYLKINEKWQDHVLNSLILPSK